MWWIISVLFFIGDCESTRIENANERFKRQGVSRSGRVGDFCSFNTDCLAGMFCSAGSCTCLSSFVAIEGYCYLKKNPGESDCNYDEQCSAIWPEAKCENGQCVCPDAVNGVPYVQAHTRDGFVCVLKAGEDGDPVPKCPLPEYDDDLLAMPVSQLRNPAMTSDEPITIGENIYPLQFCSSRSTDYKRFSKNGGGACVFSDNVEEGAEGIYIADIYDCVEVPMQDAKAVMSEIYNIHPLADGICCPNRAFTCIQPKREADVGLSSAAGIRPRWWYNAVTGACEQFMWDPWDETEMQSPNNFKTRQHCESYCHDTCKRGAPQYLAGSIMSEDERVGNCQTANSCMTNYECSNVGSMQLCCPTIASICSNAGGRPLVPYRLTNFDPGYTLKKTFEVNYAVSNRYYYDVQQGRCISFIYNGGLGNFNNFKTASECEFFCARLQCNYGAPLKIGANNQRCNSNSECPSTHECQTDHNVCCPRPQAICSQPLRPGDCKQSIRRYWYNAVARACEIFSYSGCQGNDNNFETLLDCQNTCENIIPEPQCPHGDAYKDYQGKYYVCSNSGSGNICPVNYECYYDGFVWGCCPTKTYTCTLSSNKGVTCGAGSSHRYYYNSQTQECESFLYNGCDGNPNNFATREECENYCGVGGCPNGGTPKHNELGRLIICSSSSSCPPTHECTSVNSGSSVVNRCCPTRAYICSLPPQQESSCSSSATSRFYFNIVTKECTQFTYNGCSGNLNNFATLEQCNNFCLSAACAPGDVAYVNPNTRLPYECNAGISNSCPNSFMCTYDQLSERSVCCGASNMDVCPEGEKAYVNAVDMSVRECLINVDNSCPSNYLCRFNAQRSRYYCCASISGDLCPAGKALYKESSTKNPVRCIIKNNRNQCPSGFSCQSNLPGAFQGYCCSSNYLCPNKVDFYIEESTQMPRSCTPGVFITCPSGYSCQSTQNEFSIGYCCKGGAEPVSDGCPPNEYVYVKDSDIVMCDPFNSNDASCPTGYSCQWSLANQQYQCCGSTPVVFEKTIKKASLGCPSNQVAYKNSGSATPRTCTAAAQDCPIGYFCQFSSINSQFQCCGISGGCPNDQVAFIGINGEPELCNIGQSNCPEGYSCQRLHSGNQICCTDDASACRESQVKDGGTCVNKSPIGGNCKKEAQCPNGSICANSICSCPPGMTNVDGKCRQGCLSTQILVEDKCLNLVDPGEFCEIDAQCQGKSTCKAGICECQTGQRIVNSKCVGISSKLANECPIAGQVPYIEPETTRVRFCSPSKNTCPKGFNCQRSRTSQLNVCCGRPLVGSPDLQNSTDMCDKGTAYLIDGVPQECTRIRCPSAYECKFSAKARNYYCCSKVLDDGCPIGSKALLFPSTGTPVQCSNMRTSSCPSGYECVRSIRSGVDQCCSVVQRTQIFHQNVAKNNKQIKSPCPSYQVQVKRFFNGQYITRCESSCPMKQIAINGICQNVQPAD